MLMNERFPMSVSWKLSKSFLMRLVIYKCQSWALADSYIENVLQKRETAKAHFKNNEVDNMACDA